MNTWITIERETIKLKAYIWIINDNTQQIVAVILRLGVIKLSIN